MANRTLAGWPALDPGTLCQKITILRQVTVQGASGPKVSFVPFIVDAWASIEPVSATDLIGSGQTVSQLGVPIYMNWQAGIQANMQVEANGQRYVIRDVINPLEKNVTLTLICLALKGNQ